MKERHIDSSGSSHKSPSFARSTDGYIEPNRRLVADDVDVDEFYDRVLDTRVIAMPKDGDQAHVHRQLVEARLPVFSGLYREEVLLLLVPGGTRSFRRLLKFVARDIPTYGEIFDELGSTLKLMDRSGLGLPEPYVDRPLLTNFAFSSNDQEIYGGKVFLVPPYTLNAGVTINQELGFIATELEQSEHFRPPETQELLQRVEEGWNNARG